MAHLFWEAIESITSPTQPADIAPTTAGSEDLAEAVRLLTKCTPVQLAKAIGFIHGLLSSR
jgi:hypothetical protein